LLQVSESTDVNIIMGCGYYTHDSHPKGMKAKTVKNITDEIIKDIKSGTGKSKVKSGVIGELGISDKIYPNEKKVLIAGARAQSQTGTPIVIHAYLRSKNIMEILDILSKNHAYLNKVCISHTDGCFDFDYLGDIIKTGAYIAIDCFGKEFYIIERKFKDSLAFDFIKDLERVKNIKKLIDLGFLSNILISCDVCLKILLHSYGGWGYDHILRNVIPMMQNEGITNEQTNILIRENPKKFFNIENY